MLKIFFSTLLFVFSISAFACWNIEGQLAVDGETFKLNQKVVHNKDYSFSMGTFILTLSVHPLKDGKNTVKYQVQEKKGIKLTLVTKGEEEMKNDSSEDIYAKGEEGQPNSIITLKLKHI